MKKYSGSRINAFGVGIALLFAFGPIIFAVSLLLTDFSGAVLFLAIGCLACSLVWLLYLKQAANQLYAWSVFQREEILIKCLFSKDNVLPYSKCNGCGIGFYTHGILNSKAGSKIYFIFFSCEPFEEFFRSRINLWKPSQSRVKVCFSPKLYNYLIEVLPAKQARMLKSDYEKYVQKDC